MPGPSRGSCLTTSRSMLNRSLSRTLLTYGIHRSPFVIILLQNYWIRLFKKKLSAVLLVSPSCEIISGVYNPSVQRSSDYIYRIYRSLIVVHFESAKLAAHMDVSKVLKREKGPFFTQNGHYLDSVRDKWLCIYKDARRNADEYLMPVVVDSVSRPASPDRPESIKEWTEPPIPEIPSA